MIDGECSNCVHYDKDSTEDPCYACLGCLKKEVVEYAKRRSNK